MVLAQWGTDPYTVFLTGVYTTWSIPMSVVSAGTGVLLAAAAIALGVTFRVGLIAGPIGIGAAFELAWRLSAGFDVSLPVPRALLAAFGMAALGAGVGLWLRQCIGPSPVEAFTVALARVPSRYQITSICILITFTVVGYTLGGSAGIGTAVAAFVCPWIAVKVWRPSQAAAWPMRDSSADKQRADSSEML